MQLGVVGVVGVVGCHDSPLFLHTVHVRGPVRGWLQYENETLENHLHICRGDRHPLAVGSLSLLTPSLPPPLP